MTFRNQLKVRLAGLEEHLDLPALSVNPDDLLLGKIRVRADKSNPVFLILLVPHADDLCRDLLVLSDLNVYRKQILTAPAAFFADAEDPVDSES